MMILIFCFSAQPAEISDQTSGSLVMRVLPLVCSDYDTLGAEAQKAVYNTVSFIIRKIAHFSEFALLGLLIRFTLEAWFGDGKKRFSVPAWLAGTLYAGTDELHQLLVEARSAQFRDVIIDSLGVAAGVTVAWVVIQLIRRK